MNIKDGSSDEPEDVEETLRNFLERELGFHDARTAEIQRVHRSGKSKNGKPRPILARFLRYKDVQKIFSLGHRLRETDFQMFRDHPAEIVRRRKEQMKTFKEKRLEETTFLHPPVYRNQISYLLEVRARLYKTYT